MSELARTIGPESFIATGLRLLTPPIQEVYALLVRAGILVIDD